MDHSEVKTAYRKVQQLLKGVQHSELEKRLADVRGVIEAAGIGAAAEKPKRAKRTGMDRQGRGGMDRSE